MNTTDFSEYRFPQHEACLRVLLGMQFQLSLNYAFIYAKGFLSSLRLEETAKIHSINV